ncbi:MAG: YbgA family protein, partial [Gemmatimonadota bacterium]
LIEALGQYVDWVPVCPEVEIGMGTPRPPMILERSAGEGVRLVIPETGEDVTQRMDEYAELRVDALRGERLSGYVLKAGSPSCGMESLPVYGAEGEPSTDGVGRFASVLLTRMPQLPVEEERRLTDYRLRENFVTRIFARARWLALIGAGLTIGDLMSFHARHEYLLMSRDPVAARELGRMLAGAGRAGAETSNLAADYERVFSEALRRVPDRGRHTDVLQRIVSDLPEEVDPGDRAELRKATEAYGSGQAPLGVPVGLIRHHVRRLGVECRAAQVYLEPHPHALMLLDHV